MAITTRAELLTAIENWLHRAGETQLSSRAPEWLSLVEDKLGLELRIRPMETSADLTISSQTVSLPSGFVAQRRLYISSSPNKPVNYMAPEAFWERYLATETGTPKAYTIEGDSLVFGPAPDTTYTGKILYYKKFDALTADSDTNWLLSNARGLLLYGALLEASLYFKHANEEALKWSTVYDDLMDKVKGADRMDRFPSGDLTVASDIQRD